MPITKKSRFLTPFSSQQKETKSSSKVAGGRRGSRPAGWSPVHLSSKQTVITPGTRRLIKQRLSSCHARVEDDQSSIISSGIPVPFDLSQSQGHALSQAPHTSLTAGEHADDGSDEFDLMLSQENEEEVSQNHITDQEISTVKDVQSQASDKQLEYTKSPEKNDDETDYVIKNANTSKAATPAFKQKRQQKAAKRVNISKSSCISKKPENPARHIFKQKRIDMIRRDVLTVILKMRDEIQELQARRRKLKSSGKAQKKPTQGRQLATRSKDTAIVGVGKRSKPALEE